MDRYATVGDAASFGLLFDGIAPAVLAHARNYALQPDTQAAIVRAVMKAVHEQRGRYIPGSEVMPWAMGLTEALIEAAGLPLRELVRAGADDTMSARPFPPVEGITERHRKAYALVHDDGLSVKQAAAVLDLPSVTVAKLVRHLEDELAKQEDEHNETAENIDIGPSGHDSVHEDLRSGDVVDNHRIVRRLGRGGDATVYEAVDLSTGTACAMKILEHIRRDKLARFEREYLMLKQGPPHPHIVEVFQDGVLPDGRCYYTMELLRGCTLREFLSRTLERRRAIPWRRVKQIALDVCDALCTVHDRGDVHRDIKPENIFVTTDMRAKLLDFGVAKSGQPNEPQLTADGDVIGTQAYVAPESGRGPIDARADVYSLGVTMYEMLVGRRPFWKPGARFEFGDALQATPPLMREKHPGMDSTDELEALVQRAIARVPEKRYQSVRELQRCIRNLDDEGRGSLEFRLIRPPSSRNPVRILLYGASTVTALATFGSAAALYGGNNRLPYVGPELADEHVDAGLLRISDLLTRCHPAEENEPTEPMRVRFGVLGETGQVVDVIEPPPDSSREGQCVRDAIFQARFGTFDGRKQTIERDL